ncbi:hypothetical protein [Celeribacter persicus]|uniref:Uncharacterized protein n=1 Tax=Celeribacter persicus TaxID=1651082 RepID=A0A2T5HJZ1_9RHOB|nr:hypothetical protein [Celeribacter persicus]PTQ71849.1 hypothetical protein C8N42_10727 [Celeribacter persicus]
MRIRRDNEHTEQLHVAPGVWAYVDPKNARVLKFGGYFALGFGLVGGTLLMGLMDLSRVKDPFIIFSIGSGGAGAVGMIVGLVTGAVLPAKTDGKEKQ